MVEDALVLYDKEQFFSKRIKRLRARLRELGAKRILKGDYWYWILKSEYKPGDVIKL
jgi:hypothetical protein